MNQNRKHIDVFTGFYISILDDVNDPLSNLLLFDKLVFIVRRFYVMSRKD